jgi:hypothetical protein
MTCRGLIVRPTSLVPCHGVFLFHREHRIGAVARAGGCQRLRPGCQLVSARADSLGPPSALSCHDTAHRPAKAASRTTAAAQGWARSPPSEPDDMYVYCSLIKVNAIAQIVDMALYGAFEPCGGAHAAWRAGPWAGWPLGRGAAAKHSRWGTLVGTDEALAVRPAIPAAREGRTQLRCSPDGSGTPCGPISRKYVTRLVLRRRSLPATAGTARYGSLQHLVTKRGRHADGQRTRRRPIGASAGVSRRRLR